MCGGLYLKPAQVIDLSTLAGGAAVSLRRSGAKPFSKMVEHLADLDLDHDLGQPVSLWASHILQVDFDTERFLKDYLIDGSLVIEVETELRVGTALTTRDQVANNFIGDIKTFFSASSDMVVACRGEEMSASRALLAARSPTLATALDPRWQEQGCIIQKEIAEQQKSAKQYIKSKRGTYLTLNHQISEI